MSQTIIQGDSAQVLKTIESNTIDAVITDPPYGIEFLGKEWDSDTGAIEIWRECLRVLKPGGHLLAFSAARTYHHLATRIEQVGFDIRDQIMWIYASGFPKAQDIGKAIQRRQGVEKTQAHKNNVPRIGGAQSVPQANNDVVPTSPEAQKWSGWKTALKPAHEPIVMARKPVRGSTIDNVLKHGVGALNIDATRIPFVDDKDVKSAQFGRPSDDNYQYINTEAQKTRDNNNVVEANEQGRYPSNVVGEIADHQKYFYCPKVSRRERHRGFEQDKILEHNRDLGKNNGVGKIKTGLTDKNGNVQTFTSDPATHNIGNNHPTVKPVALMRYLIKLVTAQGSHIVDPFCGSGSTGMACKELARGFTGIDLDGHYCEIAERRIAATQELKTETLFDPQRAEPTA